MWKGCYRTSHLQRKHMHYKNLTKFAIKKTKKANKHSYYRLLKRKQGPEPLRLNAAHQSFFRV